MKNKEYKVVNGTSYNIDTPNDVICILEDARKTGKRIRVFYGDVKTGRDWMEIYNTIGTVGRSCGDIKIPLLMKNKKSSGGVGILDNCIVKITINKNIVYQNPKYYLPKMEIKEATFELKKKGYFFSIFANGENTYNCKTKKQAEYEIEFHKGNRNKVA